MKLPLLNTFEDSCAKAGLRPTAILKAAGVHPAMWWKWKAGGVSPTLRKFEAAVAKLEELGGDTCDCGGCKPRKASKGA